MVKYCTCFSLSAVIFAWSSWSCFFRSAFWKTKPKQEPVSLSRTKSYRNKILWFQMVYNHCNVQGDVQPLIQLWLNTNICWVYLRVLLHLGNQFLWKTKTQSEKHKYQWHLLVAAESCNQGTALVQSGSKTPLIYWTGCRPHTRAGGSVSRIQLRTRSGWSTSHCLISRPPTSGHAAV